MLSYMNLKKIRFFLVYVQGFSPVQNLYSDSVIKDFKYLNV